jgi:hypothetical protein
MNIGIELVTLLCGLALLSLVAAIRTGLLVLAVDSAESTAPDRPHYSPERMR